VKIWQIKLKIFFYTLGKLFSKGDIVCDIEGCGKRAGNILDFFHYHWNRLHKRPYEWAIRVPVPPAGSNPITREPEYREGEPREITLCPKHKKEVFNTIVVDRGMEEIRQAAVDRIMKGGKDVSIN